MTLTGTPLLVTLVVVTVVMPALVLWTWPRVRGNRWAAAAQRVGIVLTAQLTALLLAGVGLNDYGDFFTSWSQAYGAFFGSTPHAALGNQGLGDLNSFGGPPQANRASATSVVRVAPSDRLPAGMTATSWSSPKQYQVRGAVATFSLDGPVSQLSNKVAIYLPPAYFQGDRSLPLVEAVTGYPSTYLAFTQKLALPTHLLAGILNHSMGQLVVVMVPAGLPYPIDTECTDAPGGPFAFTYFDRDVPAVVKRATGLVPTGMGAIGFSTGGYCAVKLAMLDPARFTAAVSMSGYFHAQPGKNSPPLFGGSVRVRHLNDLQWRLRNLPAPRTSVLIMTGTEEGGADGWKTNNRFLTSIRAPMHAERFIVPVDFGHSIRTWQQEVSPALVWISRSLQGVSAAGDIGSALFSRQGLTRHRRPHGHHRPVARGSATPAASASPSPTAGRGRTPAGSPSPTPTKSSRGSSPSPRPTKPG